MQYHQNELAEVQSQHENHPIELEASVDAVKAIVEKQINDKIKKGELQ